MGGIENVEKVFEPFAAALAVVAEQQRDAKQREPDVQRGSGENEAVDRERNKEAELLFLFVVEKHRAQGQQDPAKSVVEAKGPAVFCPL